MVRGLSLLVGLACTGVLAPGLSAQVDNRSVQTSRAQIEASLAEAQKILASPGYSGRIKDAKRKEIALLKSRLEDGDLQPGDQVALTVAGEADLTKAFIVGPNRTLTMPGVDDLNLKGVLRSELKDVITAHLRKYVKDPVVQVQTTIRVSFLGGIGKPGFYQVGSDMMLGDAIMLAGGPGGGVDPSHTVVQRNGAEIMSRESVRQALVDGKTIDQLNLRAGDEFLVGGTRTGASRSFFSTGLPIISGVISLTYFATRVF